MEQTSEPAKVDDVRKIDDLAVEMLRLAGEIVWFTRTFVRKAERRGKDPYTYLVGRREQGGGHEHGVGRRIGSLGGQAANAVG